MAKMFQDDDGNNSSMRIVWAISVFVVILTWSFTCLKEGQLFSFQLGDGAFLAMLFGGKIAQKYIEKTK